MVSFLIARSTEELQSFAQPTAGVSSGYRTHSLMPLPCFHMNYHLDQSMERTLEDVEVTSSSCSNSSPGQAPAPASIAASAEPSAVLQSVYPHSAEKLAQDPQPLWDLWPCCPVVDTYQLKARMQAHPITMQQRQRASSWLFPIALAEVHQSDAELHVHVIDTLTHPSASIRATSTSAAAAAASIVGSASVSMSSSMSSSMSRDDSCGVGEASAEGGLQHQISRSVPVGVMINPHHHCHAVAKIHR